MNFFLAFYIYYLWFVVSWRPSYCPMSFFSFLFFLFCLSWAGVKDLVFCFSDVFYTSFGISIFPSQHSACLIQGVLSFHDCTVFISVQSGSQLWQPEQLLMHLEKHTLYKGGVSLKCPDRSNRELTERRVAYSVSALRILITNEWILWKMGKVG